MQVTIEKWQGAKVSPFMFEEDAWLVAAAQVKQRSPKTSVVVWLDSLRIYTANKTLNPDLNGPCTTGHFRPAEFLETHPDYLLKNSSGLPALESWSGCHIFDHTQVTAATTYTVHMHGHALLAAARRRRATTGARCASTSPRAA